MTKNTQPSSLEAEPVSAQYISSENQANPLEPGSHPIQAFEDLAALTGAQSTVKVLLLDEEDLPPEESEEEKSDRAG